MWDSETYYLGEPAEPIEERAGGIAVINAMVCPLSKKFFYNEPK